MVVRIAATRARQVTRNFHPDALHVATALPYQADYLMCYDEHILRVQGKLPNLIVTEPLIGQLAFEF